MIVRARFDYLCPNGDTIRQDTGNLVVAFAAATCPTCGAPVELRSVRMLTACCGAEDGQGHAAGCPIVRRGAA